MIGKAFFPVALRNGRFRLDTSMTACLELLRDHYQKELTVLHFKMNRIIAPTLSGKLGTLNLIFLHTDFATKF